MLVILHSTIRRWFWIWWERNVKALHLFCWVRFMLQPMWFEQACSCIAWPVFIKTVHLENVTWNKAHMEVGIKTTVSFWEPNCRKFLSFVYKCSGLNDWGKGLSKGSCSAPWWMNLAECLSMKLLLAAADLHLFDHCLIWLAELIFTSSKCSFKDDNTNRLIC